VYGRRRGGGRSRPRARTAAGERPRPAIDPGGCLPSAHRPQPGRLMASPAARVLEHRLLLYRRTWRGSVFNSFLSPALFLGAMGLGLGGYVDRSGGAALGGVSYLVF